MSEGRDNRQYRQTQLRSPMSEGRDNRQNRQTLLRSPVSEGREYIDSIDKLC